MKQIELQKPAVVIHKDQVMTLQVNEVVVRKVLYFKTTTPEVMTVTEYGLDYHWYAGGMHNEVERIYRKEGEIWADMDEFIEFCKNQ